MNTSIHGMKRTVWCGELRAADAEKEVTVNGWCERTRDNGGVLFLLLRDAKHPAFKTVSKLVR